MLLVDVVVDDGGIRRHSWVELQRQKGFERCEETRDESLEAAWDPAAGVVACGPLHEDIAVSILQEVG